MVVVCNILETALNCCINMGFERITIFNHIVANKIYYCPNTIGNKKAVVERGQTIFWVFDMKIHEIVVNFITKDGYVNSELTMPYPPYKNSCFLTYEEAYEFYKYVASHITK